MLSPQFRASLTVLTIFFAALITGCGGKAVSSLRTPSVLVTPAPAAKVDAQRIAQARAQLATATRPQGVNAATWEQLRSNLDQELAARSTTKSGSALANQQKNTVTDAQVVDDGSGGFNLTWSYRNAGDYDQNGEVNISDLTPLGIHLGATSSSPDWATAQAADGDGNGLVNISDMTPIGANFFSQISGYNIYGGNSATGPWTVTVGQVPVSQASTGFPRTFSFNLGATPPPFLLLSAYDADGNDWNHGPDVLPAQVSFGTATVVNTMTVDNNGGSIVGSAGTPVEKINVYIPPNAFDIGTQVSLGYDDGTLTPAEGTQVGPIIVLATDYGQEFQAPLEITVPFTPDPNALPIPFYIDPDGLLHMCDITALDIVNGSLTFNTWHASSFAVIQAGLDDPGAPSYDTKFDPGEDGFQINNNGSTYNKTGECAGMSAFAGWYYTNIRKRAGGAPLFGKYMKTIGARKGQQIITTRAYNSIQRGLDEYIGQLKWQWKLSDAQEWFLLRYALVNTGGPVLVCLKQSDATSSSAAQGCVLAYAYVGDKLFVYDPNHPGVSNTIKFNSSTQLFEPYQGYSQFATCGNGSLAMREAYQEIYGDAEAGFGGSQNAQVIFEQDNTPITNGQTFQSVILRLNTQVTSGDVLVERLKIKNDLNDVTLPVSSIGGGKYATQLTSLVLGTGENHFMVRTEGHSARNSWINLPNNYQNTDFVVNGTFAGGPPALVLIVTPKHIDDPVWVDGQFELWVHALGNDWLFNPRDPLVKSSGTGLYSEDTFIETKSDPDITGRLEYYVHRYDSNSGPAEFSVHYADMRDPLNPIVFDDGAGLDSGDDDPDSPFDRDVSGIPSWSITYTTNGW